MFRKLWVAIFSAMVACISLSQISGQAAHSMVLWEPPPTGITDSLRAPTVPHELISELHIGSFPITLEKTTRAEVMKQLGGTEDSRGDAGDFEAWLCFHGTNVSGPWILWLTSGEIEGEEVGGFQWQRLRAGEIPDRRCASLRPNQQPKLPLGLALGMKAADVQHRLGKPTLREGHALTYWHRHDETIDNLPYTSDNIVVVTLSNGTVSGIEVHRTTVN
jgi:hypothetical protein